MIQKTIVVSFAFFLTSFLYGQVMEFDMLEMKYNQGHYKMVYRKANRLIDNPEYDFSYLPRYYRALSSMQLVQNRRWFRRHKNAITESKAFLLEMKSTFEGKSVLKAHQYELSALKSDLKQWAADLKNKDDQHTFRLVTDFIETVLEDVPYVIEQKEDKIDRPVDPIPDAAVEVTLEKVRTNIINEGKKHLGVPYKWAGNTPDGFDCSGFTAYLLQKEVALELPRRAADQYKAAKKVKRKQAKPGDFVFFDNGSGISHVGVIIYNDKNSLQMIHSSTSIGISIVDIEQSEYWSKRLVGFGTFFEN
jgi:cell wall-associated NlpC family hydrolase